MVGFAWRTLNCNFNRADALVRLFGRIGMTNPNSNLADLEVGDTVVRILGVFHSHVMVNPGMFLGVLKRVFHPSIASFESSSLSFMSFFDVLNHIGMPIHRWLVARGKGRYG